MAGSRERDSQAYSARCAVAAVAASSVRLRSHSRCVPARSRHGFTFAELLVVTLILALVLGVLGASIAAGIRVLTAARTVNTMESVVALGFEVIEKDLANTFPFYAIGFEGNDRDVSFPGIVEMMDGGERGQSLGRVSYVFDQPGGTLLRAAWAFPGEDAADRMPVTVVEDLADVKWLYAEADGGSVAWQTSWSDVTNHPAAVKVELIFRDRAAMKSFARTVALPRAGREAE
jgi:prepilin-type N-terminal cleavage/methylation domain-containing protein